jgi:ammonia channel protein AmtB
MSDETTVLTVLFTEFYYWVMIVLMFLIKVGFCLYEVAVSRYKNRLHTLMQVTMHIPLVTLGFFFFGWWIYFAFASGPGITGGLIPAPWALPWSELMGPHLGGPPADEALTADDTALWSRLNGVLWGAFLLFSWTVAAIVSSATIERIRSNAFWILAVLIGCFLWIIDASWGWNQNGWMVQILGYHDAYASGVIHAIAGGFALGVLIPLGPRIGRFRPDGTAREIPPHDPWLATVGLFVIFTGFWGFYAACNVPMIDIQVGEGVSYSATNIYLAPTTLSAITFNFLMSLSGGFLAGYLISRGDPFWTYSCALAGVISASAGNDLYHPIQAMLIGAAGATIAYKAHYWVENRFKLDDGVGAVAVHGYAGVFGVIIAGFVLWGYPASPNPDYAAITPWGQIAGAFIMFFVLGFLPAFIVASIMNKLGMLRIPEAIEIQGLDVGQEIAAEQAARELADAERSYQAAHQTRG